MPLDRTGEVDNEASVLLLHSSSNTLATTDTLGSPRRRFEDEEGVEVLLENAESRESAHLPRVPLTDSRCWVV